MTTTEIQLAQSGLVDQITTLAANINTASVEDAKSAYDRIGLAREWAKLQEDAAAITERLVWLEAVLLRRIGQLDPKALPGPRRAAARHFAPLDDPALTRLITDYPARTAVGAYNLWARAQGLRLQRKRGRNLATGRRVRDAAVDDDSEIEESIRNAVHDRITSVRQAAAILVEEYGQTAGISSLTAVVDEFISDESPISPDASPLEVSAFRKGILDATREAFSQAPVATTERSWEIPAFITVFDEESGTWPRIPSEFATVADARKMLALRKGQAESARRCYETLLEVMRRRFDIDNADPSDYLRNDTTALSRRLAWQSGQPEEVPC